MTRVQDIALGYRPRAWQAECHKAPKRFTVLALHRRAGKTKLAAMELIDRALTCTKDRGMFVYLAPFLKQAKAIAWGELKASLEPLRLASAVDILEGELTIRFPINGASIRIFGADNPEALRGLRLDGCVIDEVAWVKPEVWTEILQPALADRKGWALFIGTPYGVNLFSELYFQAAGLKDWHAKTWTVYETEALDPEEIARLRETMSEQAFAREFLCDFAAAGDDQLISLNDAQLATTRVYVEADVVNAPRVIGVDPARFGDDRSVICKRQGLQMFDPLIFQGIDNMTLAARVASQIELWEPDAVFVDSGAGAGVIDRLRQLGYPVVEVPFGGKAIKASLYLNRRTEMWFEMREWILAGGAIPAMQELMQELATPVYKYDSVGRIVLESKDDIKKRLPGAGSPDIADALALTFAAPVARRRGLPATLVQPRREYDPYAGL